MYKNTFAVLFLIILAISCSPSLHPLYKDYKHDFNGTVPLIQIEQALIEAGWELLPSPSPNTISTSYREIRDWLLYKVVVQVEAVPIGAKHVRLLVHPYRVYVTGNRSKIPFLKRRIRRRVIHDIDQTFRSYDLIAVEADLPQD